MILMPISTSPQTLYRRSHLAYLDSVRGIASFAVILHHGFYSLVTNPKAYLGFHQILLKPQYTALQQNPLLHYFLSGEIQVYLFFALSSRVLTSSYLRSNSQLSLVSSLLRRPFRLSLPTLAALLISALLYKSGIYSFLNYSYYTRFVRVSKWWDIIDYSDRPLLISPWETLNMFSVGAIPFKQSGGSVPWYQSGVLWTLPVELYYSYYVYGLAFLMANMESGHVLLLTLILAHATFYLKLYTYFVIGFVICWLDCKGAFDTIRSPTGPFKIWINAGKLMLSFLTVIMLTTTFLRPFFNTLESAICVTEGETNLYSIVTVICVFTLLESSLLLQKMLEAKPLLFLGKISFGVYLLHGPLLPLLKTLIAFWMYRRLEPHLVLLFSVMIFIPPVIVSAYLFTKYIDEPSVRLISKVYTLLFKRPTGSSYTPIRNPGASPFPWTPTPRSAGLHRNPDHSGLSARMQE